MSPSTPPKKAFSLPDLHAGRVRKKSAPLFTEEEARSLLLRAAKGEPIDKIAESAHVNPTSMAHYGVTRARAKALQAELGLDPVDFSNQISRQQRDAYLERVVQGETVKSIGEETGLSVKTLNLHGVSMAAANEIRIQRGMPPLIKGKRPPRELPPAATPDCVAPVSPPLKSTEELKQSITLIKRLGTLFPSFRNKLKERDIATPAALLEAIPPIFRRNPDDVLQQLQEVADSKNGYLSNGQPKPVVQTLAIAFGRDLFAPAASPQRPAATSAQPGSSASKKLAPR